jgi:hypothetical protein
MTAAAVSIRLIRLSRRRLHPPDRVLIEKRLNGATEKAWQRCQSDRWRPFAEPCGRCCNSINENRSILQTSAGQCQYGRIQLRPCPHAPSGCRRQDLAAALPLAPQSPSADRTGNPKTNPNIWPANKQNKDTRHLPAVCQVCGSTASATSYQKLSSSSKIRRLIEILPVDATAL